MLATSAGCGVFGVDGTLWACGGWPAEPICLCEPLAARMTRASPPRGRGGMVGTMSATSAGVSTSRRSTLRFEGGVWPLRVTLRRCECCFCHATAKASGSTSASYMLITSLIATAHPVSRFITIEGRGHGIPSPRCVLPHCSESSPGTAMGRGSFA